MDFGIFRAERSSGGLPLTPYFDPLLVGVAWKGGAFWVSLAVYVKKENGTHNKVTMVLVLLGW
jgi:hypothetical protein